MAIAPQHRGANKWYCRVDAGEENGKRRYVSRTFKADATKSLAAQRREAEKYTATLQAEHQKGEITEGGAVSFAKFADMFIEDYCKRKGLEETTISGYEHLLSKRLLPFFGKKKVRDINPPMINKFFGQLAADGLSGNSQLHYYTLLRSMLECARRWQIAPSNPADKIERPRKEQKETVILEREEAERLIDGLVAEPMNRRAFILIALFSQMRRGEIAGLDWSCLDFENSIIHVKQSLAYIPKKGQRLKSTKSKKSNRSIVVPGFVMDVLKELKREQARIRLMLGPEWRDTDAIFTQRKGDRQHVDTGSKWYGKFVKKLNLTKTTLHGLRHFGASLLIEQGFDIESIRRQLGHADAATTLRIYTHSFKAYDQRPAKALEELLHKRK